MPVFAMLVSFESMTVRASEVSLCYVNISTCNVKLSYSSNMAKCTLTVTGKSGTSSISGTLKLYDVTAGKTVKKWTISKTGSLYTGREYHHIVAKKDKRAAQSRVVLADVGIGINNSKNMVWLKKGLHKRVHTSTYHEMVRRIVVNSHSVGKTSQQKKNNVKEALALLKRTLLALNEIAPF